MINAAVAYLMVVTDEDIARRGLRRLKESAALLRDGCIYQTRGELIDVDRNYHLIVDYPQGAYPIHKGWDVAMVNALINPKAVGVSLCTTAMAEHYGYSRLNTIARRPEEAMHVSGCVTMWRRTFLAECGVRECSSEYVLVEVFKAGKEFAYLPDWIQDSRLEGIDKR